MRITTDAKTTPKVPTASSYPMLKNAKELLLSGRLAGKVAPH
jgi:hypothetical protein